MFEHVPCPRLLLISYWSVFINYAEQSFAQWAIDIEIITIIAKIIITAFIILYIVISYSNYFRKIVKKCSDILDNTNN